jgi:hypothetical protein
VNDRHSPHDESAGPATGRPRIAEVAHLRAFRAEYGRRARAALLLHTGAKLEWLAPDVLAAPWWKVL